MTAGDAILAHYRNPIGYDIDAPPWTSAHGRLSPRIFELQTAEAERQVAGATKRKRIQRDAGRNGHTAA